jgi:hypothetical protein
MSEPEGKGWLGRWAQRKAEARRAAGHEGGDAAPELTPPEALAAAPESPPATTPPPAPGAGGAEDLPPVESLTYESDFTPFLRADVPEQLRQQALRKLWRSNALLANSDGLDVYVEDFSMIGKLEDVVDTLYRVGRGMIDPEAEADAEAPDAVGPDRTVENTATARGDRGEPVRGDAKDGGPDDGPGAPSEPDSERPTSS